MDVQHAYSAGAAKLWCQCHRLCLQYLSGDQGSCSAASRWPHASEVVYKEARAAAAQPADGLIKSRGPYLEGEGAVLQLPDIERQRVLGRQLPGRPVRAPGGRVLKHLPLAAVAPELCRCKVGQALSVLTSSLVGSTCVNTDIYWDRGEKLP